MIDIHMHAGRLYVSDPKGLSASYLLRFMDANDIEKAVILPIESPEETHFYFTTEQVLRMCRRHPDRFIPFCNLDPRRGSLGQTRVLRTILNEYRDRGCKGVGELMAGLHMDDPRMQAIYEACGELGLPIIFHLDAERDIDERGLPRLEAMARKFPETIFMGHGPHFWAEISADVKHSDIGGYPSGPVKRVGAAERLLAECPNVYGDLSAGSGFNAINRDPAYGKWFLETFKDKLLFGTDLCRYGQQVPNIAQLRNAGISKEALRKITRANAERLLGL